MGIPPLQHTSSCLPSYTVYIIAYFCMELFQEMLQSVEDPYLTVKKEGTWILPDCDR